MSALGGSSESSSADRFMSTAYFAAGAGALK
jgi:hypothetical protein